MKVVDRLFVGVFLVIFAGILIASENNRTPLSTPPQVKYTVPGWTGRPMTAAESTTVSRAIDSIATPPPASIRWTDAWGNVVEAPCSAFANVLRSQLSDSGRMETETRAGASGVVNDGLPTTQGDRMNVDSQIIRWAQDSALGPIYLQETLIHEATHKWQRTNEMTNDEREIDALGAELAYKDSCGLDSANWFYRFKRGLWRTHMANWDSGFVGKRLWEWEWAFNYKVFLEIDPYNTGQDFFCSSVHLDGWYEFPLNPWGRMSDMVIMENHFMIPPGTAIVMLCGANMPTMTGRIVGLHFVEGEIANMLFQYEFGPNQGLPPRFFYSMTSVPGGEVWYVADTLNHEVVTLYDVQFSDGIPDEYGGVYASALWPGFEALETMRGVTYAVHPNFGPGIIISEGQSHESHLTNPYELCHFLYSPPVLDSAGACVPVMRYEFIEISPVVQSPLPWDGEDYVQLFATWQHVIEVWATDSLGQTFHENLGSLPMPTIDGTCTLSRDLAAGEFILPVDASNGARPRYATKVVDPTPRNLTLYLDPDGQLHLRWEAVPGADHYLIYGSEDAVEYFWNGDISETNEYVFPAPPLDKFFWRVTAER